MHENDSYVPDMEGSYLWHLERARIANRNAKIAAIISFLASLVTVVILLCK